MFAFKGCTNLITIQNSGFTSLGDCCFDGCGDLVLIDSDIANLTYLGATAFNGCSSITITTINANITNISENINYLRTFGNTISIPYLHLLSETPITGLTCDFNRNHIYNSFYGTTYRIYVGDNSSETHDNSVLEAYQQASNWSGMTSYLDTWYNFLHPSS